MRLGVLGLPGASCDQNVHEAITRLTGERALRVGPGQPLPRCDAVILAGGLGEAPGAALASGPAMRSVRAFVAAGGPVLGLCGGFALLCQEGLLPGAVLFDAKTRPPSRDDADGAPSLPVQRQYVRIEGRPTPFTGAIPAGRVLRLARPRVWQGRYAAPNLPDLEDRGQIIFRYSDAAGGVAGGRGVAGVSNARGNVVALFPDATPPLGEGDDAFDGKQMFTALRLYLRGAAGER